MQHVKEVAPCHGPQDEDTDQKGVGHGDGRSLGRGHDANQDAAQNDDRRLQRGHGFFADHAEIVADLPAHPDKKEMREDQQDGERAPKHRAFRAFHAGDGGSQPEDGPEDAHEVDAQKDEAEDAFHAGDRLVLRDDPFCLGQVVAVGHKPNHDHQAHAHQHARHDARKEQGCHAFAHDIGVDDHDARGRDDRADDGRGRGDGRRELAGVAVLFHRGDQRGPKGRGIGHSRARQPREEDR